MLSIGEGPGSRTFWIFDPDPWAIGLGWNLKSGRSYYQGLLLHKMATYLTIIIIVEMLWQCYGNDIATMSWQSLMIVEMYMAMT
jgi:hypothetical protein